MVHKFSRKIGLIAGLTVSSFALASAAGAVNYGDDDKKVKQEKVEKSKNKRTIKIIQSGKPVVIDGDIDSHVIIERNPNVKVRRITSGHGNKQALKSLDKSIKKVTKRLANADNEYEREALEEALQGLHVARESIINEQHNTVFIQRHEVEVERAHREAMREALSDLSEQEGDLTEMRVEVIEEMAEAREEIAEALEELNVELEISTDGDIQTIRLNALKEAQEELEEIEQHQLEAIKRAEKELRKTRKRLERELKKKEKEKEKKKRKAEKEKQKDK